MKPTKDERAVVVDPLLTHAGIPPETINIGQAITVGIVASLPPLPEGTYPPAPSLRGKGSAPS